MMSPRAAAWQDVCDPLESHRLSRPLALLLLLVAGCKLPALPAPDHLLDDDNDGYVNSVDCAPEDATVHPDATELCNGKDDNCNGQVDEQGAADGTAYYIDADGDGWGTDSDTVISCSPVDGYVTRDGDCNDGASDVHPDQTDGCDGIDNDCDGVVDEDADSVVWADADQDGYGNPELAYCGDHTPTADVADNPDDCNDDCAACHPGAPEVCDGQDDNCDTQVDLPTPAEATTWCHDGDGDGHGTSDDTTTDCAAPDASWVALCDDCDDADHSVTGPTTFYADTDHDQFGDPQTTATDCFPPTTGGPWVTDDTDCDDGNGDVNPDATEQCGNGVDDDCDPTTACRWPALWDLPAGTPSPPQVELDGTATNPRVGERTWLRDLDGDSFGDLVVSRRTLLGGTELGIVKGGANVPSGAMGLGGAVTAWISPTTDAADNDFGTSFFDLPDVDGDGWDEVVAGDASFDANGSGSGFAELYTSTGSGQAPHYVQWIRFDGPGADAAAGTRLTGAPGTFGHSDTFAVSAPGADNDAGAVYLVGGYTGAGAPPTGTTSTLGSGDYDTLLASPTGATRFGAGIAFFHGPGGTPSLAVGAPQTPGIDANTSSKDGAVYIFRLPMTAQGTLPGALDAPVRLYGAPDSGGHFGQNIANVGDVTGDGVDDLLIAAPAFSSAGVNNRGKVYLVSGATPDDTVGNVDGVFDDYRIASFLGPTDNGLVGASLAGCDIDGDGRSDLVFGSPAFPTTGHVAAGAAWVAYGGSAVTGPFTLNTASSVDMARLRSTNAGDGLASGLACGDVDHDGYAEVVVGAPGLSTGGLAANAGAAYLLLGTGQ